MADLTGREALASGFIAAHGWDDAARSVVAGDASNRRYDRLLRDTGQSAILMDAPPSKGEDVRPFVSIANYLREIGLSAPAILAADAKRGFLLLEDLGDGIYARVIQRDPGCETQLYEAAVDVLTTLHKETPPQLEAYDAGKMTELAALAFDWYQLGATGKADHAARQQFCDVFQGCLKPLDGYMTVLIQRDYHAENLLWLPDRQGVARVGLLDFQDAMLGHPAYDLVSILQDARRDVSPALENQMVARYLSQNPARSSGFTESYALLGLQRNLRILGVFARLCLRDGKAHYVDLIPRVWGHVLTNLRPPDLKPVSDLLLENLPAPTHAILERLKSQCPTTPNP